MIVFGLKESCSSDVEVRVADDVEKMQVMMKELEINQEIDICKVIRLGKRAETADEKPRPLKVVLSTETAKRRRKKAKNLKDKKEGGLDRSDTQAERGPEEVGIRTEEQAGQLGKRADHCRFENSQKKTTVNQIPVNEERNIKCLYTNACSVMGKMDDLRNRLVGYDVVGITESWGSDEITDAELRIP